MEAQPTIPTPPKQPPLMRIIPIWAPQTGPQSDAIAADWCEELLFGGAKYGGKSDFLLGDFLTGAHDYGPNWLGIIFRKTNPELQELIRRSTEIFPATGGVWFEGKHEWHWLSGPCKGAILRMRYLERPQDALHYQGHSYTWIGWDELTHWATSEAYKFMLGCLRWAGAKVPKKRIRASANPGQAGHGWVKQYFIEHAPLGYQARVDPRTKHKIMFIPSRVQDNRLGLERDPGYVARLEGTGSPAQVRAWLEGDWNVIAGAYFPEFGPQHIIQPQVLPQEWQRFGAFDWGSARPFCFLWFAVSEGSRFNSLGAITPDGEFQYPKNAIICYREFYGADPTGINVGLKLRSEDVAAAIKTRTQERLTYSVADPACFKQDGGPSIAEVMRPFIPMRPADNSRIAGWTALRSRLIGEDNRPMIYFFSTCVHCIRTLPALPHDTTKNEDVDSDAEDHPGDTIRYACMSRPYTRPVPQPKPMRGHLQITGDELWKAHENHYRR